MDKAVLAALTAQKRTPLTKLKESATKRFDEFKREIR